MNLHLFSKIVKAYRNKGFFLSFFFLAINFFVFAQAPESMNYQAVIRDGSGDLVASQQVGLRIKILQGSAAGSSVYEETYAKTTDAYGLVNLQLGNGSVQSGTFSTIDWGNGPYFVESAADVSGGTSYVTLSTTQFMSVPYALYAKNAGLDSAAVQAMINAAGTSGGRESFSYPVGINGTAVTYDLSTGNYTVPAGKTLYILDYLAYSGVLAINGITLYSGYHNHQYSGTSTHYEQPLIADAGDIVSGPGHFNGLLVNQSITAITYDLNSGNYTVPSGKRLYIMDYYGAAFNSAIFIEGLILFNGYHNHTNLGNSRHLAQPLVANAGEVVSGSHHFNGYIVDEDFFESSSSGSGDGGSSSSNTHYVGEQFGGGVVFHVYNDSLGEQHGYIVAPHELGPCQWGLYGTDVPGCEPGDGLTNTNAIIAAGSLPTDAANLCANYSNGGFSDWFLPSVSEFAFLRDNLWVVYGVLSEISGADVFTDSNYMTSSENFLDDPLNNILWLSSFFTEFYFDSNEKNNNNGSTYARPIRKF